jgi:hypothetical protein
MANVKSDKETWLNYKIQTLARQLFDDISSVQLHAAKYWHVFFSLKPL